MSRWLCVIALLLAFAPCSWAQDEPKPEQLKKMYDDALAQLRAAQDRKAELAKENEQLKAKVAELTQQADAARSRARQVEIEAAQQSEKTFFLRSHYSAWERFISHDPILEARWKSYLDGGILNSPEKITEVYDRNWPLGGKT